ncbi:MAG TPA: spore coat U domain-containing protein [Verrucomicrobiae bacterium]|nr:spore coat U domain-containing protein [Verrucomicrobiae bacterium]
MKKGIGVSALALASALHVGPATAASCTMLSVPTLDFGFYTAVSGDVTAEGNLLFSCVPDLLQTSVTYRVALGAGAGGSYAPRRLMSGGMGLRYNVYRDVSRSQVWGDGLNGTWAVVGACTASCAVPVYGKLFGGQNVRAAQYRDDVVITLEF